MPTAKAATRPATYADLPEIKAMMRAFADYLNAIDEPEPVDEAALDRLGTFAFGPDALCCIEVAEAAGGLVGYMTYYLSIDMDRVAPSVTVVDLFVREAWRGRGVGRTLMERAAAIVRARGGSTVIWTVWDKNPKAQAFYRRLGARPWSEEILMRWSLDEDERD